MLLSVNKTVEGGLVFLCPLPFHHPAPGGIVALFNVDPRAVYPDVELPDPLATFKL